MGLVYRLEDYARYREVVGPATYVDITRRTDPARVPLVWQRLADILTLYGAPWIVQLWTKDPQGALQHGSSILQQLECAGTTVTAQVTVTGLAGTVWEPRVPCDVSSGLDALASCLGGYERICWRYDPIIPSVYSSGVFASLASHMSSLGVTRGVFNFLAPPGRYSRVDRRIARNIPGWPAIWAGTTVEKQKIAREIVAVAGDRGIEMGCCAESNEFSALVPVRPAACGDYEWFAHLSGMRPPRAPYRGSRKGCGCLRYFDVGSYGMRNRCFGCLYCYAG